MFEKQNCEIQIPDGCLICTIVLLRDFFHIGLAIGRGLLYWPEAPPKPNTADRGPITRPI